MDTQQEKSIDEQQLAQRDMIDVFNHAERQRKAKANATLKRLGKTVADLE